MEIEVVKKAKKKIVRREYTKAAREGITSSFESQNANSQDYEADQENGRFIAPESVEARDQLRPS
jgi:hypothetical protein